MREERRDGASRLWFTGAPTTLAGFVAIWSGLVLLPLGGLIAWSLLTTKGMRVSLELTPDAYLQLFEYGRWQVTIRTVRIATTVTVIELLIAFPFALWLAKAVRSRYLRLFTLVALTVPFFLSVSSRTIVWRAVLGRNGLVNSVLVHLGVVDAPVDWLMFSEFSVHLALIPLYFPNMVLPIFIAIMMIDDELIEACRDLGGNLARILLDVVGPLSLPGVVAGIVFTFVPILGETVVPTLLGGGHVNLLGSSVAGLLQVINYGVAAALSVLVLIIMSGLLLVLNFLIYRSGGLGGVFASLKR